MGYITTSPARSFFPGQYNLAERQRGPAAHLRQPRRGVPLESAAHHANRSPPIACTTRPSALFSPQLFQYLPRPRPPHPSRRARWSATTRRRPISSIDVTSQLTLRAGYRYLRGDATVLAGSLEPDRALSSPARSTATSASAASSSAPRRSSPSMAITKARRATASTSAPASTSTTKRASARSGRPPHRCSFQANFRILDNQNPAPDIRFDFRSRDNSLALFWTPGRRQARHVHGRVRPLHQPVGHPLPRPAVPDSGHLVVPDDRAHTATAAADFMLPGSKMASSPPADRCSFRAAAVRRATISRWRGSRCRCISTWSGIPTGSIMASESSSISSRVPDPYLYDRPQADAIGDEQCSCFE